VKKCRELNSEIVSNAAKVQTALRLSEEDATTIAALRKEIEKAWKVVDASHEKEAKAKETIQQLKVEIATLQRIVDTGSGSVMDDATVGELLKAKEDLGRDRDRYVEQVVGLRRELLEVQQRLAAAEAERMQMEADLNLARHQVLEKKGDADREARRKDRLERDVRDLKHTIERQQADILEKTVAIQSAEDHCKALETMVREAKASTDKVQKEYNSLTERAAKLHHELAEQSSANQTLLATNSSKAMELRAKEEEITAMKAEITRVTRVKDHTQKKVKSLEDEKAGVESARDDLRVAIATSERELELLRKELGLEKKKLAELDHERGMLTKLKTQAEKTTVAQSDLIKVNENSKRTLLQEVQGYKVEASKQAKTVFQLEKDREKYGLEANDANAKYMHSLEELRERDIGIKDLQKEIGESEGRLRQQQNLYESVRAERNAYSKSLLEAQDEITEMKRKFKILQHQIEQLKEEIGAKDLALVKEHFDHMKVEKEKESLKLELNKARAHIGEVDAQISTQRTELEKLNGIINEADHERMRQRKEYDMVINERDILGTQLIRRNDELALLYEKIKLQQSSLTNGQLAYRDRVNEIRVLKIKVTDMKRELHILKSTVANVDVLKREVHHLGRELLQERTKVKALSEELENPLNVHRWRKLEGSDPSTYEMIQKIQTLQKRLIAKTEEVVEKDLLIQEKEKLYLELKNIMARQPGPEVAEQLSLYQANLREKTKQMKAMASELNMYQAQVNEYKYEIDRLARELNDMKKRYFEAKRREQVERERDGTGRAAAAAAANAAAPAGTGGAKFVGGGFSLAAA